MQIKNIGSYNYSYSKRSKEEISKTPVFREWQREVYKTLKMPYRDVEKLVYRNYTALFRGDREIPQIMDAIVKLHKKAPKIHTRFYGCSFGAETYSAYMYVLSKYGENILSKFLPFKAMDIDEFAIKKAKEGILPVNAVEFFRIQKYTGDRFNEFFHGKEIGIPDGHINDLWDYYPLLHNIFEQIDVGKNYTKSGSMIKLNEKYTKNIHYSVADVMKDWQNIEPENSVTSLRNFLPYLKDREIITLITGLGKHLKKDSCLILGSYDFYPTDRYYSFFLNNLLSDNGFKELDTDLYPGYVYRKTHKFKLL